MMVVPFPTVEDRAAVQTAVDVFLWTQKPRTRLQMLQVSRAILDRYGVSKMHVGDYAVRKNGNLAAITARNPLPAGQRVCPGCGADIYKLGDVQIVSIREGQDKDLVTYGCKCGIMFTKSEDI